MDNVSLNRYQSAQDIVKLIEDTVNIWNETKHYSPIQEETKGDNSQGSQKYNTYSNFIEGSINSFEVDLNQDSVEINEERLIQDFRPNREPINQGSSATKLNQAYDNFNSNRETMEICFKVNLLELNPNKRKKSYQIELNQIHSNQLELAIENEDGKMLRKQIFRNKDNSYLIEINPAVGKMDNVFEFEKKPLKVRVDILVTELIIIGEDNSNNVVSPLENFNQNLMPGCKASSSKQYNTKPIEINILTTNSNAVFNPHIFRSNISSDIIALSQNEGGKNVVPIKPSTKHDLAFQEWDQYYTFNVKLPERKEIRKIELFLVDMVMKVILHANNR